MRIGPDSPRFTFVSAATPEDTFAVIRFTGREGLSELYNFGIDLVSEKKDLDLTAILDKTATFTIKRPGGDLPFHGILQRFEQHHAYGGLYFYRAELAPRLWWLTLTSRQAVFLDEDIAATLTKVLKDGGLGSGDFEFRLAGEYPKREFVCQYGETHYAFFARWLEHYGMYYFFEQTGQGEKCIITDTRIAHTPLGTAARVAYAQPSALEDVAERESAYDFRLRRELTPNAVTLKDFNYRTPQVDLTAKAELAPHGSGETYLYGGHYRTLSEGRALAKVRAEELACRMLRASGKSFAPFLRPGYTFALTRHPRADFNQEYLTVSLRHHGYQSRFGTAGLGGPETPGERESAYRNEFAAIPAALQFRPQRDTPRARIHGSMNARIDAAGSGTYAELDEKGRYKVRMAFDGDERPGGKASASVRMAEPYGGAGFGLHCPLHKDTEVAVTFIDGNPDRPVISGAAPNPDDKSPVASDTQTSCRLTTASGNKMHIEDKDGSKRLLFTSTDNFLRVGAHNDPPPPTFDDIHSVDDFFKDYFSKDGITISSSKWFTIKCMHKWTTILGERLRSNIGVEFQARLLREEIQFAWHVAFLVGPEKVNIVGNESKAAPVTTLTHSSRTEVEGQKTQMEASSVRTTLDTVKANGQVNESAASKTQVAAAASRLAGQKSQLSANETEMNQSLQKLAGQSSVLCQDKTALALSSQRMAGQKTVLQQSRIDTIAQKTKSSGQRTSIAMNFAQTAANATDMAMQQMETAASHNTL